MIGEQLVPNTQDALVARAVLRDIRHTPQKARRVVDLVRGMRADEALNVLKFAPQAAGSDVFTLLNSAIANAKQQNQASVSAHVHKAADSVSSSVQATSQLLSAIQRRRQSHFLAHHLVRRHVTQSALTSHH